MKVHYYIRVVRSDLFLTVKEKTTEIHRELIRIYGENCVDVSNMWRWKRDFENSHSVLLEDEQHSGWLAETLTVDKFSKLTIVLHLMKLLCVCHV